MYTLRDNENCVIHKVFLFVYLLGVFYFPCGIGVLATGITSANGMEISFYVSSIFSYLMYNTHFTLVLTDSLMHLILAFFCSTC